MTVSTNCFKSSSTNLKDIYFSQTVSKEEQRFVSLLLRFSN